MSDGITPQVILFGFALFVGLVVVAAVVVWFIKKR